MQIDKTCPECGINTEQDLNAARNLLAQVPLFAEARLKNLIFEFFSETDWTLSCTKTRDNGYNIDATLVKPFLTTRTHLVYQKNFMGNPYDYTPLKNPNFVVGLFLMDLFGYPHSGYGIISRIGTKMYHSNFSDFNPRIVAEKHELLLRKIESLKCISA